MKSSPDLSISQRLALGFVVLFVMIAVLQGAVYLSHERSAAVQQYFLDRVGPRSELADEVERSVLYVSIAARAYLVNPVPARMEQFEESIARVRIATEQLSAIPLEADGIALYRKFIPQLERYIAEAKRVVDQHHSAADVPLARAREAALATLRQFVELQGNKTHAVMERMGAERQVASRALTVASALMTILLAVLAFFTIRAVRRPTKVLQGVARALQQGNWKPALELASPPGRPIETVRNEFTVVARAFGAAAVALERREQRLRADAALAAAAASSLDKHEVGAATLGAIIAYAQAEVGLVYVVDDASQMLHPVALHGCPPVPGALRIGEGVPGQAARERRTIIVDRIPRESEFEVKLGYDKAPPRAVVAVPVVFREKLLGVIVLASLRDFDDELLSFLKIAAPALGIALNNANAYAEIQALLAQVNDKNRRIQEQNEELQAQNEEIHAQSEELQAQTEEIRTQNEQLKQHTEELRAADARKNEFLGFLSHELRNPMAAITNALFLFKRAPVGGEQWRQAQGIIERQNERLTRLVDDLLDMTRISRGKINLQRKRIDLVEVVRECIEDHRASFREKDLKLEVQVPVAAMWVNGDRTRLCQVIDNLISNAAKFSDKGHQVTVRLECEDSGDAILQVIDEGIGIPGPLLQRVFEPFTQAINDVNGGLGLGLALVKGLVELHGGKVEAQSAGIGQGARFIVRLPVKEAPAERANISAIPLVK